MTEKVRAFTAIDLPSEVVSALGNLTAALDAANLRGLRTVRPEAVHLTLKFLGSVPSGRLEAVASVLTEVAGAHRPFALEVGSVGAYPKMQSPRVLWVGLAGDLEPLLALQRGVEDSLARLGPGASQVQPSPHGGPGSRRHLEGRAQPRRRATVFDGDNVRALRGGWTPSA